MSEWPYVIAAYSTTWLVLGVFALSLVARAARARRSAP